MPKKFNPFRPNQPVYTGMFAGRVNEISRIDTLLFQTLKSNPSHILILGERGIGKTSLLFVANHFGQGTLSWEQEKYNFLAVHIVLQPTTNFLELAKKINIQIGRALSQNDKALAFVKNSWKFLTRIQTPVISLKPEQQSQQTQEELLNETIYSIVDTVKFITEDTIVSDFGFRNKKDGLIILIDEVDQANKSLDLGVFLKNLSEILTQEGANKVLFILAGLPKARDILRESHESSLRLFEEFHLTTLGKDEVADVVKGGLSELKDQKVIVLVSEGAIDRIHTFSEGYPHFVQQIAYSAYELDSDNNIDVADVDKAMFQERGAIDLIGDRYYRDLYYGKIKQDSYREILSIMSEKSNEWISLKEIRGKFRGKDTTLTNGIKALRDRNIILSKPGRKGLYRLQWVGFAAWIYRINQRAQRQQELL